jgi:hypothetical protein
MCLLFLCAYRNIRNICMQNSPTIFPEISASLCFSLAIYKSRRSQWPRGLRRGFGASRLLGMWVRIQTGAWMFVCCGCCVLSGRDLCNELINRPEESYRLWCVVVCDLKTSRMRSPWPALGRRAIGIYISQVLKQIA